MISFVHRRLLIEEIRCKSSEIDRLSVVHDLISTVLDETRIVKVFIACVLLSIFCISECSAVNLVADPGEDYTEFCKVSYIIQDRYDVTLVDGITTSSATNKLIDSIRIFTGNVDIGDRIHNTTDDTYAYVTAVDNDTQLSISSDIMGSEENYTVYDIVASGTTTSSNTNKLIDSGATFTITCTIGDRVHNTTDDTSAFISAIDSDTQLSISSDIMVSGENYEIFLSGYEGNALSSGTLDFEQSTPNAVIDSTGGFNDLSDLSEYDKVYFNSTWHIIISFTDTQLNLLTMDEWVEPTCLIQYEFDKELLGETLYDAEEDQSLLIDISALEDGFYRNKVCVKVTGSNVISYKYSSWIIFAISKNGNSTDIFWPAKIQSDSIVVKQSASAPTITLF